MGGIGGGADGGQGHFDLGQAIAADEAFGLCRAGPFADKPVPAAQFAVAGDEALSDRKRAAVIAVDHRNLGKAAGKFGWCRDMVRQGCAARQCGVVLGNVGSRPTARCGRGAADIGGKVIGERGGERGLVTARGADQPECALGLARRGQRAGFAFECRKGSGGFRFRGLRGSEIARRVFARRFCGVERGNRGGQTVPGIVLCRKSGRMVRLDLMKGCERRTFGNRPRVFACRTVELRVCSGDGSFGNAALGPAFGSLGGGFGQHQFGVACRAFGGGDP